MGQAETTSGAIQKTLDAKLNEPSLFVEDMTPEDRAKFYKTVLKVSSPGNTPDRNPQHGKYLLPQFHSPDFQPRS